MSPLLAGVWTIVPSPPVAFGLLMFLNFVPVTRKESKLPDELVAYTVIWPLLLTPQATELVSPFTSMLLYLLPIFEKPWVTLAESRYRPTTSPLSLIPVASVPLDLGKLTAVNLPLEY